jgi:hypothetical protein
MAKNKENTFLCILILEFFLNSNQHDPRSKITGLYCRYKSLTGLMTNIQNHGVSASYQENNVLNQVGP